MKDKNRITDYEGYYSSILFAHLKATTAYIEGKNYIVQVPSIDCLLADKLIAFSPHTTGITIESGKYMEIMKQMFDICTLVDYLSNYEDFIESYIRIANQEIGYCGILIEKEDILLDTLEVSKNIISRGKYNKDEYEIYLSGIRGGWGRFIGLL